MSLPKDSVPRRDELGRTGWSASLWSDFVLFTPKLNLGRNLEKVEQKDTEELSLQGKQVGPQGRHRIRTFLISCISAPTILSDKTPTAAAWGVFQ